MWRNNSNNIFKSNLLKVRKIALADKGERRYLKDQITEMKELLRRTIQDSISESSETK